MLQISVAQLYDDNRDKLGFAWIGERRAARPSFGATAPASQRS